MGNLSRRMALVAFATIFSIAASAFSPSSALPQDIDKVFKRASLNYLTMEQVIPNLTQYPHSLNGRGNVTLDNRQSWVSGFYPGCLWYLYEYSHDKKWYDIAVARSADLENLQHYTKTHDLGFMVYCPIGNGARLTDDPALKSEYEKVIVNTAEALCTRFNPTVGAIRSWDNPKGADMPFKVIIDNMMNLELLFRASEISGNMKYRDIAITHANTTLKNHFREDGSAYHILCYDTKDGKVIDHLGGQGFSDKSAWSRGQAWGLYGFTVAYRFTKDAAYLENAVRSAEYILTNPALPKDMVPYWDYNSPSIPETSRDASAAAICASALVELSEYVPAKQASRYLKAAKKILKSLSKEPYLAERNEAGGYLTKYSVTSYPDSNNVDKPLIYADYYLLEALLRLRK